MLGIRNFPPIPEEVLDHLLEDEDNEDENGEWSLGNSREDRIGYLSDLDIDSDKDHFFDNFGDNYG
jgi:hypothetical protein